MSGDGSSKRRRFSGGGPRHLEDGATPNCLADLPSGILEHVAIFLAAPSRALFAEALAANDGDVPNSSSSSAIVGSHEVLDFGDIENDLAEKLSDDDIQNILLRTDAVNKVKKIMLTNCVKITGAGLEPLRGSAIIEQIDLSILEFDVSPGPSILCEHVLPILHSIIEREGCVVKQIQFPKKWRREIITESDFHAFLIRYNEMWESRGDIHCPMCVETHPDEDTRFEGPWVYTSAHGSGWNFYGTHQYVCYGCMKYYCHECDDGGSLLHFCYKCERSYCVDCATMEYCSVCQKDYCMDHCKTFYYCDGIPHLGCPIGTRGCGQTICKDCISDKRKECRKCKKTFCSSFCSNRTIYESEVERCDHCCSFLCNDCENPLGSCNTAVVADFFNKMLSGRPDNDRLRKCNECNKAACNDCQLKFGKSVENLDCRGCVKMIVSALLEEKEMNRELEDENKELRSENKALKSDIRDLKAEVEWFSSCLRKNS